MITEAIKLLKSKPYKNLTLGVEIAKGKYHLGNFKKKIKRNL